MTAAESADSGSSAEAEVDAGSSRVWSRTLKEANLAGAHSPRAEWDDLGQVDGRV